MSAKAKAQQGKMGDKERSLKRKGEISTLVHGFLDSRVKKKIKTARAESCHGEESEPDFAQNKTLEAQTGS